MLTTYHPPLKGKTQFALLVSLLRDRAEVKFGPEGPGPSLIIPGKEPGQVSQTLGHLQRKRPEWKFQPTEAPSTPLPTAMPTLAGSPFKTLIKLGNLKVVFFGGGAVFYF